MNERIQGTKQSFFDKQISVGTATMLIGMTLLLGVGFGAGNEPLKTFISDKFTVSPAGDLANKDFSLYWQVYQRLSSVYVDPAKLDAQKMFYGSIKGMVEAIGDAPTAFFDPTETTDYKKSQSGSYSGIGAELDYVNQSVVVVAPFEGSPAMKAGIEAQDIIIKVDGSAIYGKTLSQVVSLIRGTAGTSVSVTILRPRENNREYTYSITRGNVNATSMELKEIKDGVAVVKINRFTEASIGEWSSKWSAIVTTLNNRNDVERLVIDLRSNPGGYFDAAVILASDFLPKGTVIAYQRERNGVDETYATKTEPRLSKIPVVVLVNGSSASASEIFAGAMKHHNRATIVGESTYGKGTAQVILDLTGGSSLHVTVSKWLLPDKSWINPENTIKPNKEVTFDYDLKAKGIDNQLEEAIKAVKELN